MNSCTVIFYHYVRNSWTTPFPEIRGLSIADFDLQLEWLQSKFKLIDYAAFKDFVFGHKRSTEPCALLTFDDGLIDHYESVFPILVERGISGVFFVTGTATDTSPDLLNVHKAHFLLAKLGSHGFAGEVLRKVHRLDLHNRDLSDRPGTYRYDQGVEARVKRLLNYELPLDLADRVLTELFEFHIGDPNSFAKGLYLSSNMIREMAQAGMIFGGHTKSHRILSRLGYDDQYAELKDGVTVIRQLTGQDSVPFCYPYGHVHTYNDETLSILERTGYAMAFNTVRSPVEFDSIGSHYELPRFDTRDVSRRAA